MDLLATKSEWSRRRCPGVITEAEEIEKLCSGSSLYIVCTGDAFRTLPQGRYRSRRIGEFSAPGIAGECLYDIFDSDPYALIKLKEQFSAEFAKAVSLFESGDFTAARTRFMDIVKYAPDDGAARNYLYLAEHNINSGAAPADLPYIRRQRGVSNTPHGRK